MLREDETQKLAQLLSAGCVIAMWRSIPTAAGSLQQVRSIALSMLFESF